MTNFEQFESDCMKRLSSMNVIVDVGGGQPFQKGMAKYRELFAKCTYKTLDASSDYSPDIVGDIHAMPIEQDSIDGIVCRSVLEHVARPHDAVREMHRVLKPGGAAFVQVPSIYPYHARTGHGAYPDLWRFFDDTLRMIFRDFSSVEIVKHGGWFYAMTAFLPYRFHWIFNPIALFLDRVFRTEERTNTRFFSVYAIK